MPWYRFEKFFKGGSHHDYLFLKPWEGKKKLTHEQLQEEMRDWGEKTSGGHNYGYTVNSKYAKRVPLKVLRKKLESYSKYRQGLKTQWKENVKRAEERIKLLEGQIKKQKVKK